MSTFDDMDCIFWRRKRLEGDWDEEEEQEQEQEQKQSAKRRGGSLKREGS